MCDYYGSDDKRGVSIELIGDAANWSYIDPKEAKKVISAHFDRGFWVRSQAMTKVGSCVRQSFGRINLDASGSKLPGSNRIEIHRSAPTCP